MHAAAAPSVTAPAARRRRVRGVLAGLALAVALAATFWLYLRPGLALDLGQLMAFCGFR